MAADGSVIIEVNLNTNEAEKALGKLKEKISDAEKIVNDGPRDDGLAKALDAAKEKAGEVEKVIQKTYEEFGWGVSKEVLDFVENYANSMGNASQEANEMRQALENAKAAVKNLEGQGKWFGDEDYDEAVKNLERITADVKLYRKELVIPLKQENPFELDTYAGKIKEAETALKRLEAAGKGLGDNGEYDKAFQDLARLKNEAKQYATELTKTTAQREREAAALEKAARKTQEAAAKEAAAAAESAKLRKIKENATMSNQGIVDLNQELSELKARLSDLKAAGAGIGYEEYDNISARIKEINAELKKYEAGIGGEVSATKQAEAKIGAILKKMKANILKTCSSVVKDFPKKFISVIQSVAKGFSGLLKNSQKVSSSFSGGIKNILKYALGLHSLYVVFNKLRSALTYGFKNLAQFSAETNASISSIKSALTQLKNSLATAFAPVLDTVAPILTKFINMLSSAADYVARLTAALTGKTSYTKAVAVQEDYVASLGDTAAAADEAAGSLAGFDEITTITTEDTKSASGGTGTVAPDEMFEEVEIEPLHFDSWGEALDAFLTKLLESIPNIKNALSDLASNINDFSFDIYGTFTFPDVQEKASEFGKELADALNGLVNEIDWYQFGQALGSGINTELGFLVNFLYEFDWMNLGKNLAELVNGLVSEIDGYNFGMLLWAQFKIALETLAGFLLELDMPQLAEAAGNIVKGFFDSMAATIQSIPWSDIGTQIATFLNEFDWIGALSSIGTAISEGINAAIELLGTIIEETKWEDIGKALGISFSNTIKDVDWGAVGNTLSNAVSSLFEFISSAIENADWEGIGKFVRDFLVGIDWGKIASEVFETIGAAFGALTEFLWGFIKDACSEIVGWWHDNAYKDGEFTIEGLLNGILNALKNIGSWIKEHIFQPIIDGFKKAFGIHSPSTVMKEQGEFLIAGLLEGIKGTWDTIVNFLKEKVDAIKEQFSKAWGNVKETAEKSWGDIKESLGVAWDTLIENAKTAFGNIKTAVTTVWDELETSTGKIWEDIENAVKTPINAILGFVDRMVNGIIDGLNMMISALNKLSFSVPDWVPGIGGSSVGFDIPSIPRASIPALAVGAVIPPNREFLAVLGDQRKGNNLEGPESLFRQIVREESGNNNIASLLESILSAIRDGHIIMVDGTVFGRTAIKTINRVNAASGRQNLKL